ncbi:MAG: hypothetical protein LBB91_06760, partial [Clostridiales bacterium]|nr:hypothetical protein [Clostridiales bacterium]
ASITEQESKVTAETSSIKANIAELESKVTAETSSIKASITEQESKVTAETSSIKANIAKLELKVTSLEESVQTIRDSQLIVENIWFPKINAALDGILGEIEKNKEQDRRISVLENKVENHGVRIISLEYAAKAK